MAHIKTEAIKLATPEFQMEIAPGWMLDLNDCSHTLTRGKKSMTINNAVLQDLCTRNYGLRLVKGRRQMVLPPHLLQALVENELFLLWWINKNKT